MTNWVDSSRTKQKKYDDKEDLEIKSVANAKYTNTGKYFLCLAVILFGISLGTTILALSRYSELKSNYKNNIIEIQDYNKKVIIVSDGFVNKHITNDVFIDDEYRVENIAYINLESIKNDEDTKIHYNVKYNIRENEFIKNIKAMNNSDLLVRFSYSFDQKEWIYINNAISTSESSIVPLMGKYYDIAGIKDTLKVATNNELEAKAGKSNIIYWKSETIFQNKYAKKMNNNFQANFKIEYVEED